MLSENIVEQLRVDQGRLRQLEAIQRYEYEIVMVLLQVVDYLHHAGRLADARNARDVFVSESYTKSENFLYSGDLTR